MVLAVKHNIEMVLLETKMLGFVPQPNLRNNKDEYGNLSNNRQ
jgi:hypothetical protein